MRIQNHAPVSQRAASACLTIALLASCYSSPPKPDPEKLLQMYREQALAYYDAGALLQAEDQIRKGLDIKPSDDQLKLMLGWCRQRRGTRDDLLVAENVFRDLAPRQDYRALLGLAECLERKGVLYHESAEKLRSGMSETEAADPKKRADEIDRDANKFWTEALTHYQAVLAKKPTESQGINGLQRTYAWLGQAENSLEWAEKLIVQSDAESQYWLKQLKRANLRADEETQMRASLNTTRELTAASHMSAASLLVKLGRKTEAVAHLDALILIDPTMAEAYSRRAQLLFDLGRFEEARANMGDFLRLSKLPFDHPSVQRAFEIQAECDKQLKTLGGPAK